MRSILLFLFPALAGVLLAQTAAPEAEPPVPTFKSKVQVVLVDLIVTNPKNAPVRSLKQGDFHVFEDGKPQTITSFEEHGTAPLTQIKLPALPPNVFSDVSTIQADSVNVLLLDWLNTQPSDQAFVHAQVLKYIQSMPPGTHLAIFSMGTRLQMIQGFTTDPAELLSAIEKNGPKALHISPLFVSETLNNDTDSSIALMQMNRASAAAIQARSETQQNIDSIGTDTRIALTLEEMRQLARYLGGIPGRKNVIWFAGSFPIGVFPRAGTPCQYDRAIAENANLFNASRVAIYPVATPGLFGDRAFEAQYGFGHVGPAIRQQNFAQASNQDAMEEIARDTGGEAFFNTNGVAQATAQAISDGEHYYTISYTPSNKAANGKYRHIEVKTDGKYQLSYRRGYYAEDSRRAPEVSSTQGDPLLPLLEFGLPDSSQIVYSVRVLPVNPQPAPDAPHLGNNVDLKGPVTRYRAEFAIAEKDVRLDPAPDGSLHGQIELMMVAYNRDGKPLNLMTRKGDITLTPAEYERFAQVGLQMQSKIDIPTGDSVLRTGIYDLQSNLAGTLLVPLHATAAAARTPAGKAPSQP